MPGKARTTKKKYALGGAGKPHELKLPSIDEDTGENNVCLVRRPGVQKLIRDGLLDSLDGLTGLVGMVHLDPTSADKAQAANLELVKEILKDPSRLEKGLSAVDKVVASVVVEPVLSMPPGEGEQRDPDKTYVDMVDFDDRMFIFQWVLGGSKDLEAFRQGREAIVDGLADEPVVPVPTE